jgi:hypothetical protein
MLEALTCWHILSSLTLYIEISMGCYWSGNLCALHLWQFSVPLCHLILIQTSLDTDPWLYQIIHQINQMDRPSLNTYHAMQNTPFKLIFIYI